jgi:hypothetical protein
MTDIFELLDQDEWWEPQGGPPILVETMRPSHVHNLLAWFERKAPQLKTYYEVSLAAGPQPYGEMACDVFESACEDLWNTPVLVWLNEFPLIQKLRELQRAYRAAEVKLAKARNLAPAGATAGLDRNRERRFYTSLIKEHLA